MTHPIDALFQEHNFMDETNTDPATDVAAPPVNEDEDANGKLFTMTNSSESEEDAKDRLHIWHVIAIAADRLLMILLIVIIIIIGVAALAK